MQVKSCPVEIKAAGSHDGTEEGVFEAIVAAYNVDSYGDKITPGAFADSLKSWADSGAPIPVYWSHRMDDPDYNIGHVIEAKETEEGLWVKAKMDLEGAKAQQVYRLLKGRRVRMFSFSYDIEDSFKSKSDNGDDINELRRLKLYEVGPCALGVNQATDLLAVKAAEAAMDAATAPQTDTPAETAEPDEAEAEAKATPPAPPKPTDVPPKPPSDGDKPSDPEALAAQLVRTAQALLNALKGDGPGNKPKPSAPPKSSDDEKATPDVEPAIPSSLPEEAKGDEPSRQGTADLRLRTELALLEAELELS